MPEDKAIEFVPLSAFTGDLRPCLEIAHALPDYFNTYGLSQMTRDLGTYPTTLAVLDGKVTGFICTRVVSPSVYEILWMAIDPKRHRQGIGRALLNYTEAKMISSGAKLLTVKTLASSAGYPPYEKTRQFYEQCGFLLVEVIDPYPGWEKGNPCGLYVKPLS